MPPPKVLVIEDDFTIRELTGIQLQDLGVDVILAPDGETGVTAFMDDPGITHVICDFVMPGLNSYGVYMTLRRLMKSRATKFVLCSGGAPDSRAGEQMRQLRAQDGMGFLAKPFTIQELAQAVGRHADESYS